MYTETQLYVLLPIPHHTTPPDILPLSSLRYRILQFHGSILLDSSFNGLKRIPVNSK